MRKLALEDTGVIEDINIKFHTPTKPNKLVRTLNIYDVDEIEVVTNIGKYTYKLVDSMEDKKHHVHSLLRDDRPDSTAEILLKAYFLLKDGVLQNKEILEYLDKHPNVRWWEMSLSVCRRVMQCKEPKIALGGPTETPELNFTWGSVPTFNDEEITNVKINYGRPAYMPYFIEEGQWFIGSRIARRLYELQCKLLSITTRWVATDVCWHLFENRGGIEKGVNSCPFIDDIDVTTKSNTLRIGVNKFVDLCDD